MKRSYKKRLWAVIVVFLIFATWFLGALRSEINLASYIQKAVPEADHVVKIRDGLYSAWGDSAEKNLLGYVALGRASGYGGPLTVAAAVNPSGEIINAVIADHKETPAWMMRVSKSRLLSSMAGKRYEDAFKIGSDLDGVTGATATSRAIAGAVVNGSQAAARQMGLPSRPPVTPEIIFGIPEIVLLALFITVYLGSLNNYKYKRQIRWISMLTGMIILGFIYNNPLTLIHISKFIMGYWPQWQTDLYWYLLLGGILIIFIVNNRNLYCEWFCPFGAAQECMGLIGGINIRRPRRTHNALRILQRILALGAVLTGLYFRNPGLANYELYGTLFALVGTSIQFAALGLILIAAMYIRRPWCNYLCPIKPVLEIIRIFRGWVSEIWKRTNLNTKRL
ncbi:4Fe-4S binding protein [Thermodesulfobacteriota bacterium]